MLRWGLYGSRLKCGLGRIKKRISRIVLLSGRLGFFTSVVLSSVCMQRRILQRQEKNSKYTLKM